MTFPQIDPPHGGRWKTGSAQNGCNDIVGGYSHRFTYIHVKAGLVRSRRPADFGSNGGAQSFGDIRNFDFGRDDDWHDGNDEFDVRFLNQGGLNSSRRNHLDRRRDS